MDGENHAEEMLESIMPQWALLGCCRFHEIFEMRKIPNVWKNSLLIKIGLAYSNNTITCIRLSSAILCTYDLVCRWPFWALWIEMDWVQVGTGASRGPFPPITSLWKSFPIFSIKISFTSGLSWKRWWAPYAKPEYTSTSSSRNKLECYKVALQSSWPGTAG